MAGTRVLTGAPPGVHEWRTGSGIVSITPTDSHPRPGHATWSPAWLRRPQPPAEVGGLEGFSCRTGAATAPVPAVAPPAAPWPPHPPVPEPSGWSQRRPG